MGVLQWGSESQPVRPREEAPEGEARDDAELQTRWATAAPRPTEEREPLSGPETFCPCRSPVQVTKSAAPAHSCLARGTQTDTDERSTSRGVWPRTGGSSCTLPVPGPRKFCVDVSGNCLQSCPPGWVRDLRARVVLCPHQAPGHPPGRGLPTSSLCSNRAGGPPRLGGGTQYGPGRLGHRAVGAALQGLMAQPKINTCVCFLLAFHSDFVVFVGPTSLSTRNQHCRCHWLLHDHGH